MNKTPAHNIHLLIKKKQKKKQTKTKPCGDIFKGLEAKTETENYIHNKISHVK